MEQTEFQVREITISKMEKHPNADTLSIVDADGYPVIVRTADYKLGDKAVYVPVDAVVPLDDAKFNFLRSPRIKAVRIRGIFSMGLLVPWDAAFENVSSLASHLRITKHLTKIERAEMTAMTNRATSAKKDHSGMKVYGLDSARKYPFVLQHGETVVISEKIHGCNARYVYRNGKFYVGSHRVIRGSTQNVWDKALSAVKVFVRRALGVRTNLSNPTDQHGDLWWKIAERYDLENKLSHYPHMVLYGEIYGAGVQDLTYDAPLDDNPSRLLFRAFDVFDQKAGKYLDYHDFVKFMRGLDIPTVPLLYVGPWDNELRSYAEGPSLLNPKHVREGIVIKPIAERNVSGFGRVALKLVGEGYHLRSEAA